MADEQIILRPEKDIHEQVFTEKNVVHRAEFRQVWALIDRFTEEVKQENKSESTPKTEPAIDKRRVHHTITLSGSRGSGKTSFLKTLIAEIENNSDSKIAVLEIVDPTPDVKLSNALSYSTPAHTAMANEPARSERNGCTLHTAISMTMMAMPMIAAAIRFMNPP